MAASVMVQLPSYIEPEPVAEQFASGPAFIKIVGDQTYIVLYTDSIQPPELGGTHERRISQRLILPNDAAERLARMLLSCGDLLDLATRCLGNG